jgi:fermentation-respiration switch protein FrsA (DUF1100 family)
LQSKEREIGEFLKNLHIKLGKQRRFKPMQRSIKFMLALAALTAVLLAGCSRGPVPAAATATAQPTAIQEDAAVPTQTPPPPTPAGTATAPATAIPSSTATPSATPPHPLSIAYLQQQEYPGSEIVVEESLPNGPNYFQSIVSYRSEGLKIRALLTVPFGETPENGWPVVVFNHGYIPPEIYRTTERYVAYVAGFATNGYIVLRPDYRGHDQSEGEARGAYGRPDYTIDVLNAVAALKAFPLADPERIGMWGHSMGGYITLRAMLSDPAIRAGVIWAGVVGPYPNIFDRQNFSIDATPTVEGRGRWRLELFQMYGDPEQNPGFWDAISANSFLDELSGRPIQLHHGTADTSVPYSVSELLYNQLLAAEQPAEFYGYPGDDHNLSIGFSLAMQRSIQFFDSYVRNRAD